MANPEGTPQTPNEPPAEHGGIISAISDRINWPATAVVSAAATLAASVAFHEAHFPDGSVPAGIQRFLTPDVFGIDYHTSTSRRYVRHHTVRQRHEYQYGSTADNFYLDKGDQAYARDFAQDPEAGEYTDPKEFEGIISDLAGNVKIGYEIKGIRITGYASAEDDSPDGGLTTPSEKKLALARKRASTVRSELERAIDDNPALAKAAEDASITYGAPVEQELTEAQADKIGTMARAAGFDSAEQLVDAWNTGQADVPEADSKVLADILGDARKVEVHVAYGHPSRDVIVAQKYCVRYNIDAITTHKQHQRDPLPLPVPLIIPIPWLRRRGKGGGPEVGPDEISDEGIGSETAAEETEPPTDTAGTDEYVEASGNGNGAGPAPRRIEPTPDRYTDDPRVRRHHVRRAYDSSRIANTVAGFTVGLLGAAALFVNVSGRNCHEDGHTPRPLLIDAVWEAIDDDSGRGADVSQTISLGIPFVSGAQLKLGDVEGNIWQLDGEKACERPGPAASGPAPKPPRCSQVDIVRRNGKTVSKRTVYQAPPISTRRIVRQHR